MSTKTDEELNALFHEHVTGGRVGDKRWLMVLLGVIVESAVILLGG